MPQSKSETSDGTIERAIEPTNERGSDWAIEKCSERAIVLALERSSERSNERWSDQCLSIHTRSVYVAIDRNGTNLGSMSCSVSRVEFEWNSVGVMRTT